MDAWTRDEGFPLPQGVTFVPSERRFNFSLYSKHATEAALLLYSADDMASPRRVVALDPLRHRTGRTWHVALLEDELDGLLYYGWRVDGPFDPASGHRFDPAKVALDPYARGIVFPPGYRRHASVGPGSNAGRGPLGVIRAAQTPADWSGDVRPRHTHDAVIYELHVRGFTRDPSSGVPVARRGTFAGLVDKIPYLTELGVTIVELMPVFQFDPDENNYWGYMTLGFFAPHAAYAAATGADAILAEFRDMVRAMHRAGIEVVLDVVFNHTTEGGADGPTYSWRAIDNSTYYLLEDDRSRYRDDAGTGNVMHTANRQVRAMVLDSLRFWVHEMGVDGFRFDLASLFTRRSDGAVELEDPPIISAIRADPALCHARLIAEAWDLAAYQLGRSFPGISWMQWNGKFRDDLRGFVRGDAGLVGTLMTRLYGSTDLFGDALPEVYRPWQSVNYVTSHDGFTLYDLVSYHRKRNHANGHDNDDGPDDNRSWNCGWEGDEGVPDRVRALRFRQIRNFATLMFLANGTPMMVMGDEVGRTQGGNNNPYNQDNETSWFDWNLLERNAPLFRFFRLLIGFRKRHPALGRSHYWRTDVAWYGVDGGPDLAAHSRSLALCIRAGDVDTHDVYALINGWTQPLDFALQEGAPGDWHRVIDTARDSPNDILEPETGARIDGLGYQVEARSVVVLVRKRS